MAEEEPTQKPTKASKSNPTVIHPADLKAMLKDNREIGKLSNGIPQICAAVCDEFVKELLADSLTEGGCSFDLSVLINSIKTNKKYDFLETVVPKFQEILDAQAKKRKNKSEE